MSSTNDGVTSGSPRAFAVRILINRFDRSSGFDAQLASEAFLGLEPRDQVLVKELINGTCRWRGTIDFFISALSRKPLSRLDKEVLWILRTAIYQIVFLRVPNHAAVNEAVSLCRHFRKRSAAGYVNGLLRSFLRGRPEIPEDHSVESLAIRFSHPSWLVERYVNRFGLAKAKRLLSRNNTVPEPVVWVNPFKTTRELFLERLRAEGIEAAPLGQLPAAAVIKAPRFHEHPLYREGSCFFMDPSSQRIANLVDLSRCEWVADVCSAPGGKAMILASQLRPEARLICADSNWRRLDQMKKRFEHHGVRGVSLALADLTGQAPWRAQFDFVLADVPCSGLGTIRSNPDVRWSVHPAELDRYHIRQLQILRNAFAGLKPGGEMVYSTCSTEVEENEEVVNAFLQSQKNAAVFGDFIRTFAEEASGDGFFAARIRRL